MAKIFLTRFVFNMKVQNSFNLYCYNNQPITLAEPMFKGGKSIETITHYNLGMMPNGFIGKVKVLKANNEVAFLNVFKHASDLSEIYKLKDGLDRVIGQIEFKPRKYMSYDDYGNLQDSSHIFVDELRNFSRKGTPYYVDGLDEYKQVGVRLMQIAQRRSDECGLNGNIELISKNESKDVFYEKLGFKQYPFLSPYVNPNKMYLPAEAKEPFSKMYGGL